MTKILIVDDDIEQIEPLKAHLSGHGYEITIANDGEQALESVEKDSPDVLVLDIMMPKKNGFEVLKELRANPMSEKWQPVIITSSKKEFESIKKGYDLQADFYLPKPYSLQKLLQAIQTMVSLIPLRKRPDLTKELD